MTDGTPSTPEPRYLFTRWNFPVLLLDASFYAAGLSFIDPTVVLPVLVARLSGSDLIIGLIGAVQRVGWILPQVLAASLVLHRQHKKPFLLPPCIIGRLPLIALAVIFMLPGADAHPRSLLVALVAIYTLFVVADGFSLVPWNDIVARTIPPRRRGRFFGGMQFVGGLLAIGTGAVVRHVLADPSLPFPRNYGVLFLYLSVFMVISLIFLALIKEPPGPRLEESHSLMRLLRALPLTLRRHPLLLRIVIAQNLLGLAGLAVSFYTVYAYSRLGLPEYTGGIFIWAGVVGALATSLLWAHLNDHRGPRVVIRVVAVMAATIPLAALLVPPLVHRLGADSAMTYAYALVFLLNGATWGGLWIGITNYVLDISPHDIRPLFLGLTATLSLPTALMPLVGGWLLGFISYEALFAITVVGGLAALVYALRLETPPTLHEA